MLRCFDENSREAYLLIDTLHRLCFPLVSIGNKHMATNATSIKAPDAKTGAFGSTLPA